MASFAFIPLTSISQLLSTIRNNNSEYVFSMLVRFEKIIFVLVLVFTPYR